MKVSECGLIDQIFSFITDEGKEYHWNTTKVQQALDAGRLTRPDVIPLPITQDLYEHVRTHNGIESSHLTKVTDERLGVPVFFVEFPDEPEPSHVLADGNHRLVAAYERGRRDIPAYIFTLKEMQPFEVTDFAEVFGRTDPESLK